MWKCCFFSCVSDRRKKSRRHRKKKMQHLHIPFKNRKLFCPGTSRDRGVCPGTFAPVLVPGQRDTGTRNFFCPGTSRGTSRPVKTQCNPPIAVSMLCQKPCQSSSKSNKSTIWCLFHVVLCSVMEF